MVLISASAALGQSQHVVNKPGAPPVVPEPLSLVRKAKSAAMLVKNDFQRGLILENIGAAEAYAGDLDGAVETARQAYPHTSAILATISVQLAEKQVVPPSVTSKLRPGEVSSLYWGIADGQAKRGDIAGAMRTIERIDAPELRSSALQRIAEQQSASGDEAGARRSITAANGAYSAQRLSPADEGALIAEGQLSRGDLAGARKTIATITPSMQTAALLSGAQELLKRGDATNARLWLQDAMKDLPAGRAAEFLQYLAIPIQVQLGQLNEAMKAASGLSSEMSGKAYAAVAVTCAEQKDEKCVDAAVSRIISPAKAERQEYDLSRFSAKLHLLNISAALIEHEQYSAATRLLDYVERDLDEISRMSLQRESQLHRVLILAHQRNFDAALSLALKMRANSVADIQRGTALRSTALLQTREIGTSSPRKWATGLQDPEDRAYALLGIAQALLKIGDVKLPYAAINIH